MAAGATIYDLTDGRACVAYYVEGKRRRETFTSKREAQRRAHEIEALKGKGLKVTPRAQAAGDDTARYCQELLAAAGVNRPLTSVVEEYLAATKALGAEGTLLESAESFRRARQEQGGRPVVTVAALREEYRQHLVSLDRDADYIQKSCGIYLGNFQKFFPTAAIHTLTTADLGRWWATIKGAGRTRNNYRNAVEALFSFARARDYLPREKATEASFLGKVKELGRPANPFTLEEMAILLTGVEERDLPFIVIGGFAGVRSREQAKMTWEANVNWDEEVFVLEKNITKISQRRLVPMLPVARAWLEPFRARKGSILDGPHPEGRATEILRDHGLGWRHNGLRDAFASYRLAAIADVAQVATEMGNSSAMVLGNYRKVVTPQAAALWWELFPGQARSLAASVQAAKGTKAEGEGLTS